MMDVTCEQNNHNIVFRLTRNGTAIGNNSAVPLQGWVGWKSGVYDANDDSTPQSRLMSYLDSPGTTSTLTYQLRFINHGSATTFYLNRSVAGAAVGQSGYEIATSSVMLQEIAQ